MNLVTFLLRACVTRQNHGLIRGVLHALLDVVAVGNLPLTDPTPASNPKGRVYFAVDLLFGGGWQNRMAPCNSVTSGKT